LKSLENLLASEGNTAHFIAISHYHIGPGTNSASPGDIKLLNRSRLFFVSHSNSKTERAMELDN